MFRSYDLTLACVFYQVRGIKGVFLANQKINGKVTTLITYNKGRDWEPLAPPATDMNGKPITCKKVPFCLNVVRYLCGSIELSAVK